jgi:predicted Zn-dependent protease
MKSDKKERLGFKIDFKKAAPEPLQEDVFDDNTKQAVKKFQQFNKLPITGNLDNETLNLIKKPRCDVPDIVEGNQIDYNIVGRWNITTLTYRFENFSPDLQQNIIRSAIRDAFNQWSTYAPLNLDETTTGGNIRISWATGDHGDGYPFDDAGTSAGNILAHAFFPMDGRVHFDEAENWTNNNPPSGIDLATVAVHEFGHSLGLGHSTDTTAVMYAYYSGLRRNLLNDDIFGIRAIYGLFDLKTFRPWVGYGISPPQWLSGDFNGDGKDDLIHLVENTNYCHPWLSRGDGTFDVRGFSPWANYGMGTAFGQKFIGDFNGDGKDDLIHLVQNTDYVHTWLSRGDGTFDVKTFRPSVGYAIPNGQWLVGDFNNDRRSDLLHLVRNTDYAHVWFSKGDGTFDVKTFRPWPGYGISSSRWLVGNFTGDRKSDLIHLVQNTDYTHIWNSV